MLTLYDVFISSWIRVWKNKFRLGLDWTLSWVDWTWQMSFIDMSWVWVNWNLTQSTWVATIIILHPKLLRKVKLRTIGDCKTLVMIIKWWFLNHTLHLRGVEKMHC